MTVLIPLHSWLATKCPLKTQWFLGAPKPPKNFTSGTWTMIQSPIQDLSVHTTKVFLGWKLTIDWFSLENIEEVKDLGRIMGSLQITIERIWIIVEELLLLPLITPTPVTNHRNTFVKIRILNKQSEALWFSWENIRQKAVNFFLKYWYPFLI